MSDYWSLAGKIWAVLVGTTVVVEFARAIKKFLFEKEEK